MKERNLLWQVPNFFWIRIVGCGVQMGPLGTSATEWPTVPAPGVYDDGEFGGMKIGRGNRSTRRKPTPAPLCPPQIPIDQNRVWTRAIAVGSQWLTAWAMPRPWQVPNIRCYRTNIPDRSLPLYRLSYMEHNTVQIRWTSQQILDPTTDFVLGAVKR
jgi:hypothetical protein